MWEDFSRLDVAVKGICRECKSCWEQTGICQGHMALELLGARWLGVGAGLEEQPCVVGGVVV